MANKKYIDFIKSAENSVEYWTQTAITDFTEEIARLMEEKSISRATLAKRIGSSQAYITKVLRGNVNFTLSTMTKLAHALGMVVRIHLSPKGAVVHWYDEYLKPIDINVININEIENVQKKQVYFVQSHDVHNDESVIFH